MPHHPETRDDEVFMGNYHPKTEAHRPERYKGLRTRTGDRAFDIHGKDITAEGHRPFFLAKADHAEHERRVREAWRRSTAEG